MIAKTLSRATFDVATTMMGGRTTGDEAWAREVRAADNETLLAWSRDKLVREPGCEYIGKFIADEMQRRIEMAPPLEVTVVDFGAKS